MSWWVTPSGTTVSVNAKAEYEKSGHAAAFCDITVSSTGGDARTVTVRFDDPNYVNMLRSANSLPPLDEPQRAAAATVAVIRAVDADPEFFVAPGPLELELGYDQLDPANRHPAIGARALRRYIARRLYLSWEHGSLDQYFTFTDADAALTGSQPDVFLRNLQILEEEGYVEINRTFGADFPSFAARPTGRLIRDVEQYGAAEPDVESEADYAARLSALQVTLPEADGMLSERRRYLAARTVAEVTSVFRAIVPMLEGVVRRLLQSHGSNRQHTTLGPMIGDLRARGMGDLVVWSQLSAVQNNARDISLHGGGPANSST